MFAIFALGSWCLGKLERSLSYAVRRFATLSLCTIVAAVLVYLYSTHTLYFRYTVAVYYMLSAASFLLLLCGFTPISHAYKLHDYLVGHSLFFVIAVLSTLQIGVLQVCASSSSVSMLISVCCVRTCVRASCVDLSLCHASSADQLVCPSAARVRMF